MDRNGSSIYSWVVIVASIEDSFKYGIKVPFISRSPYRWRDALWYGVSEERYLPKKVLFDKDLWQLHTGKGSTYYMLAKGQLWLPGIDLAPSSFGIISDSK